MPVHFVLLRLREYEPLVGALRVHPRRVTVSPTNEASLECFTSARETTDASDGLKFSLMNDGAEAIHRVIRCTSPSIIYTRFVSKTEVVHWRFEFGSVIAF